MPDVSIQRNRLEDLGARLGCRGPQRVGGLVVGLRLRPHLGLYAGPIRLDLLIDLEAGTDVAMKLPSYRVEPSDALLAGLERIFGEKVVELV